MKISIIIPTNRYGGFDITFSGLGKQTFDNDDWEVIIIDDFIENRQDECISIAKKYDIKNLLYLRPKPHYWRSNTLISNSRNTGLVHVKGKLIVFLDDYMWVPPRFLEQHWNTYRDGYCMVGKTNAVKYVQGNIENIEIDKLSMPVVNRDITYKDTFEGCSNFMINISKFGVSDTRGNQDMKNCGAGWFYTCNASAPLDKIINVNGFDEEYDLTRQVDIGLGLMLERVGCKFYYKTQASDCVAYHMDHMPVEQMMKDKNMKVKRYKNITYDELRKRGTIESNIDEIQLVPKEKYNTQYDGAWALNEYNTRIKKIYANIANGKKIFDLKEERRKIGNLI
jgi:glycosyltransferase involved in cell wall biosynthesis